MSDVSAGQSGFHHARHGFQLHSPSSECEFSTKCDLAVRIWRTAALPKALRGCSLYEEEGRDCIAVNQRHAFGWRDRGRNDRFRVGLPDYRVRWSEAANL